MSERVLPFPRGSTMSGMGIVTGSDTLWNEIEGKIFKVPDTVHKTGEEVWLRAVKNDSASALTVGRKLVTFSLTSDYDHGRRVSGLSGAGAVCKPFDDTMAVDQAIPAYDIFYVIEQGWSTIKTEAGAVNLPAGAAVASAANGLLKGTMCAQATEFAVGTINAAVTDSSTDIAVKIYAGLQKIGT